MVSYEISCRCGALSMFVGAGSIILSEQVHPGCIQRQREPCVKALGCLMRSLRWPLGRIIQILSWLFVSHFVALGFACCIACLPATLVLQGCVRSTLASIEHVRRKNMGSRTGEAGRVKQERSQTTTRKKRRHATLQQRKVDVGWGTTRHKRRPASLAPVVAHFPPSAPNDKRRTRTLTMGAEANQKAARIGVG